MELGSSTLTLLSAHYILLREGPHCSRRDIAPGTPHLRDGERERERERVSECEDLESERSRARLPAYVSSARELLPYRHLPAHFSPSLYLSASVQESPPLPPPPAPIWNELGARVSLRSHKVICQGRTLPTELYL